MIDYDKLKIAHELADKYVCYNHENCTLTNTYYARAYGHYYDIVTPTLGTLNFKTIDSLISKLKELTQPDKPKYEVGQEVWFVRGSYTNFKPEKSFVSGHQDGYINFFDRDNVVFQVLEEQVYPSREALIEAQIEYWQSLANKECEHEYQKTLAKSGMYFISMCHKCHDQKPYTEIECHHESDGKAYSGILNACDDNNPYNKCTKCEEFYI